MKSQSYMDQGYEYLSVVPKYFNQVYRGYGYLYKASTEIAWEQIGLDSVQDGILDSAFEKLIQLGHSTSEIILSKCCSGGFIYHLQSHLVQKTASVIFFPWIAPILSSPYIYNIPGKFLITEGAKLSGISPLEGLYSLSAAPKMILGENNTISNTAEYFTFHDIFNVEKAKDHEFNQYIKFFKSYMEFCDAWGHTIRESTTLYNNRHLTSMSYKTYAYAYTKLKLYYNTKQEEAINDKRIEKLSLKGQQTLVNETNIDEDNSICLSNEDPSWRGYIYNNKWNIAYKTLSEVAYAMIFKKFYSTITNIDWKNYLPKTNPKPNQPDIPYAKGYPLDDKDNSENPTFLGWLEIGKELSLLAILKRTPDDEVLQQAAKTFEIYDEINYPRAASTRLKTIDSDHHFNQEIEELTNQRVTTPPPMVTAISCPDFRTTEKLPVATPSPSRELQRSLSTYSEGRKPKPLPETEEDILEKDTSSPIIKPIPLRRPSDASKSVLGDEKGGEIDNLLPPPLTLPSSTTNTFHHRKYLKLILKRQNEEAIDDITSISSNHELNHHYNGPFCQLCAKQPDKDNHEEKTSTNDMNNQLSSKDWLINTLMGKCTDPNCKIDHDV